MSATPATLGATAAPAPAGSPRRALWQRPILLAGLLAAAAGFFVPGLIDTPYTLSLLINGVVLGIAAVGIGFLMHQCGFVMFGVAAFIGLPAYLVGIGSAQLGLGLTSAVVFALVGSTAFAALVGALVVRARPLPFAMLTLALAQMLKQVSMLQVMRPITGGDDGLTMSFDGTFLGLTQSALGKAPSFWPLAWAALCLVILIAWVAAHSRFGQVLRATQANEERMRFSGFDTYWPPLAAFTLSAFLVSISGVLIALNSAYASPELLDFATGGHALTAMIVGGGATALGPLLGAMLYTWGQSAFGATGYLELLTGIAVVVMISAFPKGAMGFVLQIGHRLTGRKGP